MIHKKSPRKGPYQVHDFIKITYDAYKKYYNKFYKRHLDDYISDMATFKFNDFEFAYKFHHYFNEEGVRRFSRESFNFIIHDGSTDTDFYLKSLESRLVYEKCKFYSFNIKANFLKGDQLIEFDPKIIYPKDIIHHITMTDYDGKEYRPFYIIAKMLHILENEKIKNLIVKPQRIQDSVNIPKEEKSDES